MTTHRATSARTSHFDAEHPGLREFLRTAAQRSSFASSLYVQLTLKGSLSERQTAVALRMQEEDTAPKPAAATVDLAPIRAIFETAVERGLKKPTYRAEGLVISLAPAHGQNAGALYVKAGSAYQGKLIGTEFHKVGNAKPDTVERLKAIARNPLEAAVRYGRETGTCSCCGRTLTNAESIELGIGPICRSKWGL